LDYAPRAVGPLTLLPKPVLGLLREVGRHILRRPVVGICAVARTEDGRILLIRRGDTGGWCLPGGTLEWGETLAVAIPREIVEETGADVRSIGRVTGIYSRPDRDLRFHAVTVCVLAEVTEPRIPPMNSLEIREVGLFAPGALPTPLSMGMEDILRDALEGRDVVLE
jgi:8-oxo-dGTP diphosphatase